MSLRFPLAPSCRRWVPTLFIAGLICYWSIVASPPSIPLESPSAAVDGLTRATVAGLLDLSWLDVRHGIAYAALALSLEYALESHTRPGIRTALLVFVATVSYGAFMELGQLFRPDRVASLADAASNVAGTTAALVLSDLEQRGRQ